MALGVGELVAGLGGSGQSLVGSVGNAFIQQAGGDLARTAIRLFSTGDKPALVIGIVTVCLLLGAALGAAARRRPWVGPVGFAVVGAVGVLAAARDPLASTLRAAISATVGVTAGSLTLLLLLHVAATEPAPDPAGGESPTSPYASRRAFFGWAGAAGAFAATAAVAGRSLRSSTVSDTARAAIRLPRPTNQAVPGGAPPPLRQPGLASFDVDGLSPYLVPNRDFYRIDTALVVPQVGPGDLAAEGHGHGRPARSTSASTTCWPAPWSSATVTLSCVSNEVGGDLVGNARWLGVPLRRPARRGRRAGRGRPRSSVGRSTASPWASRPRPCSTAATRWSRSG